MTSKKPPPKKASRLRKQDIALWRAVTHDVIRAQGKDYLDSEHVNIENNHKPTPPRKQTTQTPQKTRHRSPAPSQMQLDRRTDDRLRKGHIRPSARLDLHGMGQTEAHGALNHFINRAYRDNKRCVLVITGKGEPRLSPHNRTQTSDSHWMDKQPGVLRRRVPEWLQTPPINAYVIKHHIAQPKDGGSGALYVYLRKNKE